MRDFHLQSRFTQNQRMPKKNIVIIYSEIRAKAKLSLFLSKKIGWVNTSGNGSWPNFPDKLCLDSLKSKQ
jgi:hypothetical protein